MEMSLLRNTDHGNVCLIGVLANIIPRMPPMRNKNKKPRINKIDISRFMIGV